MTWEYHLLRLFPFNATALTGRSSSFTCCAIPFDTDTSGTLHAAPVAAWFVTQRRFVAVEMKDRRTRGALRHAAVSATQCARRLVLNGNWHYRLLFLSFLTCQHPVVTVLPSAQLTSWRLNTTNMRTVSDRLQHPLSYLIMLLLHTLWSLQHSL